MSRWIWFAAGVAYAVSVTLTVAALTGSGALGHVGPIPVTVGAATIPATSFVVRVLTAPRGAGLAQQR